MQRGLDDREAQHDAEARVCFEKAVDRGGGPRAVVQLALAEQALGKWVEAYEHLSQALKGPPDPWVEARRAPLVDALNEMERNVGKLEIDVSPAVTGVMVRIDEGATEPYRPPLVVLPGRISVEVSAPGYESALRTLTIAPQQLNRASVTLRPVQATPGTESPAGAATTAGASTAAPAATPAPGEAVRPMTHYEPGWFVVAGVGAVVAMSAVIPWEMGSSELKSLNRDCPGGFCDKSVYDSHHSKIQGLDTASTTLLISGSVVAASGLALGLLTRRSEAPIGAWLTPAGGGVTAWGRF
jgi:hypothetical protein